MTRTQTRPQGASLYAMILQVRFAVSRPLSVGCGVKACLQVANSVTQQKVTIYDRSPVKPEISNTSYSLFGEPKLDQITRRKFDQLILEPTYRAFCLSLRGN
jgi:hypothetical protein